MFERAWAEPRPDERRLIETRWKAGRDHDWDGLNGEGDVRAAIHERFARYAKVGGAECWWSMIWTEMSIVYLAQLTQADAGKMKKLTRRMRKNTERWWRAACRRMRSRRCGR